MKRRAREDFKIPKITAQEEISCWERSGRDARLCMQVFMQAETSKKTFN